jgi:UDPglucose--hexose-1-phosphate uridylyltransferase
VQVSGRRLDPTTGEWITFATHRQDRTFLPPAGACPLCPASVSGAEVSETGDVPFDVAVFDNRFPSMQPDPPEPDPVATALMPVLPARGRCEVVVYSADHGTTLARAGYDTARTVIDVWADRWRVLGAEGHHYVMPFENKGEVIGVTLNHPHGQVYAFPEVPPRPLRELRVAAEHRRRTGRCVDCDVVAQEIADGRRMLVLGNHWVAHVPFWARFPYEVRISPREHHADLAALSVDSRDELAQVLTRVLRGLDELFDMSTPYVMGVFSQPTGGDPAVAGWSGTWEQISHLHLMISPPHRTATKLKYLAGSELMAGAFVTDVAPEQAATRLREAMSRAAGS